MHTLPRTAAALTAAAVLALTGCETTPVDRDNTGDRERRPNVGQKADREPAPEPADLDAATRDDLYLTVVRDGMPAAYAALPDRQLIGMADAICEGLDAGLTFTELGMIAYEEGVPPEAAGTMMGAGVVAYCPEHESKLP